MTRLAGWFLLGFMIGHLMTSNLAPWRKQIWTQMSLDGSSPIWIKISAELHDYLTNRLAVAK